MRNGCGKVFVLITVFICAVMLVTACGKKDEVVSDNSEIVKQTVESSFDWPGFKNAQELVDYADLIFVGTVKNIEFHVEKEDDGEDAWPENYYTVDVEKVYKGQTEGDSVTVRLPGEGVCDGIKYVITCGGVPDIREEEKYLFFASSYENSYPGIITPVQGVYNMDGSPVTSDYLHNEIALEEILSALQENDI